MNQVSEIKKVKDRIAALAEKTTDRGCSEAEAMTAIAMVGKLLTQYNLTMNEVLMRDETYLTKKIDTGRIQRHPVDSCIVMVSEFCQTRLWTTLKKFPKKSRFYHIFGTESDVDMTIYLAEMLKGAINQELNAFKLSPDYRLSGKHGKTVSHAFSRGMVSRINSRLRELMEANKNEVKISTGTSLIVLKGQLLKENFEKLNMRLRKAVSTTTKIQDSYAYAKGQEAGSRVNLSRPVGNSSNTLLRIGSR